MCHERVFPGNNDFIVGDRIKRHNSSAGQGSGEKASNTGQGEDDFVFELSREEFLELYFEDLELPDLVKKQIASLNDMKSYVLVSLCMALQPTSILFVHDEASYRSTKSTRWSL